MKLDVDALNRQSAELKRTVLLLATHLDAEGKAVTQRQLAQLNAAVADTALLCVFMAVSQKVGFFQRLKLRQQVPEVCSRIFKSPGDAGSP